MHLRSKDARVWDGSEGGPPGVERELVLHAVVGDELLGGQEGERGARGEAEGQGAKAAASSQTENLEFGGFDSSRSSNLRSGIPRLIVIGI